MEGIDRVNKVVLPSASYDEAEGSESGKVGEGSMVPKSVYFYTFFATKKCIFLYTFS